MAVFPSKSWGEAVIAALDADPETKVAGRGWDLDFGAVVESEPGLLEQTFVGHAVTKDGKVVRFEVLEDVDALEEREPSYLVRAPYSIWKALLKGTLDPIEAVLKRKLSVSGDLQPLIARMKYKGLAERVLAQVKTEFADEP